MRKDINYEAPKMEINYFELADVITTSLNGQETGDGTNIDGSEFNWD